MYQDEAGFGRISKLGSCWAPIGVGPHVHSHYIREFRYCYGAVDAPYRRIIFLNSW
ncbi:DDE_3 domain protein, partial [Streptococcus pneumoniae]